MKSFGKAPQGERLERLRDLPMWDGEHLRNIHPVLPGLRDPQAARPTLREFLCGDDNRTPPEPLPAHDPRAAWLRRPSSGLRATWLGHSTVLLEIDGWRVLTDPVWGQRASPFTLLGPKRFQPVPVGLRDLPAIDAVVISHDHYDYLDYPTIRALAKSKVPFVTSLGVGAHLESWGIEPSRITELVWWQSHRVLGTGLTITAAPSQHFSGRGLKDRNQTLWSSMVMAGERHRVFFSGDTGLTTEYESIRDRLGPFDLVMLEVGAFHPSWGDIHLGPANALAAHRLLGGGVLMPVHWGTFALSTHAWDEPVEDLLALADPNGTALLLPRLGEPVEPVERREVQPWWRHGQPVGDRSLTRSGSPEPAINEQLSDQLPWPLD
ncbi:MBL fold metallo-hydrolase [Rhodanobacter sp. 7MK24]|uniref:MBL fold metallo-hydrolase n=1 Tax=Rhodanobacter sp. 7MK24 TaxID=2775922 RepID=UPI00177B8901|nr:MBL fold metallo-hydrolase [Rhodanobacter sp. 7MK24]MBD8879568.1 MBL fold metallo-hydrolase [Rhodanobacter sp. 7MK24]